MLGPTPRVITVDAKQRDVFVAPPPADLAGKSSWRICAEAAPDVFSALSASASLEADITSRSGKAAAAIAESAGTIERTQTVNLLRESMYRTCERFLSGALTPQQFIVQAARDQRSMVAVLAIEQLTRAARPAATILAAGGTSASVASDKAATLIQQFSTEKSDAGAALKAAAAKYQAALATGKCDSVTTAPAAGATGPSLAEWTACTTAKTDQAARQADSDAATARLDKVIDATLSGGTTNAATTAGTNQPGGGTAPSSADLAIVADKVREIAMAPGIDEPLMFCIAYLSDAHERDDAVKTSCIETLQLRALADEKLRGAVDLRVGGDPFTIIQHRLTATEDTARPRLLAYLSISDRTEGARRIALARKGAQILGLEVPSGDLVRFLIVASPDEHRQLLDWLRANETVPAALATLNGS